jgi:hypothetical protein
VKVKVIKIGGHIPQAEDVEAKLRAWGSSTTQTRR